MHSLIITLIALAVFTAYLSIGANDIDVDSALAKRHTIGIESTIADIGMGMTSFRTMMGIEAMSTEQLVPAFSRLKMLPNHVTLSAIGNELYDSVPNRRYACFDINLSTSEYYKSLVQLNAKFDANDLIYVSDCSQVAEDVVIDNSTDSATFKYYY